MLSRRGLLVSLATTPYAPEASISPESRGAREVWHALRIWDGWAHDRLCCREMIRTYIGGHD
jgi:hypothetical protein